MASYDDTATVSGSVVSISDGADEVGAKSCVVTVSPTLSGVSSVTETHIPSRNMASVSDADFTLNNVHYYADDGIIYIDGTSTSETSSNNNAFKVLDFWLPSGTYYFSRGATLTSLNVPAYLKKYDDKSQIVVNTGSFTLAEKTHLYIAFYVYQRVFSNIKAEICINLGSTAITYEDTAPMTTYTASLGRTIYGGQADIVNGTGTDENGNDFTFDGQEVPTRLGYNAFWSDSGDTELTYYKSGYGFTSVTVHKETPDGDSVVQTAKLHKIVYGGTADVVKGTCEPINWLPNVASSKTQNDIIWTVNADGTVTLEGTSTARTYLYLHTYFKILPYDATITVNVEGLYDNGTSDVFVNIPYSDNGTTYSGSYGQCTWKNPTKQINYTADKYIGFYIDCPSGTTTNQTVKITVSIGTTVHTYSPYFEPFTFPPISMETDEGENTLFANEGASAITYRKDAE